jgi:hypothetical protein
MSAIVVLSVGGAEIEIDCPTAFEEFAQSAVKEMSEGNGSGWWMMETTKKEKIFIRLRSIDTMKQKVVKKRKSKKVIVEHDHQPPGISDDIY